MKAIRKNVLFAMAAVISAFVVFASGYLCVLNPDRPWPYWLAIAVVGCAWTANYLARGDRADAKAEARRRQLTQAIVLSGLLLAVALGTALMARLEWTSGFVGELGERSRGLVTGAVVVVLANAIPKQVSSGRRLAMLRIAGWALVMGGVGYALAWLLLPLASANFAALLVLLSALTYAVVRIVLYGGKHRCIPPSTSG